MEETKIKEDRVLEVTPIFIGIDVSKAQLDVAIRPTGERESVANDKSGIKALVKRLAKIQPAWIVLEATRWAGTPTDPCSG